METTTLSQLLKLPAGDRAELAIALWESLSDAERHTELALTDEQAVELDRRWAAHVADHEPARLKRRVGRTESRFGGTSRWATKFTVHRGADPSGSYRRSV